MSSLTALKLDRIRRKILAGELDSTYLANLGKMYLDQRQEDIPVLQALSDVVVNAHDVALADRCSGLLLAAGVRDESVYERRLESLLRLGNVEEGRRVCREAIEAVKSPDALAMLRRAAAGLGAFEISLQATERLLALDETNAMRWSGLGTARQYVGDLEGAEEAYRKALELDEHLPLTRLLLSACRKYSHGDNNIASLRNAISFETEDTLPWQQLAFSLGKELEDLKEYPDAFHWYSRGAASVRRELNYTTDTDKRMCELLLRVHDLPGTPGVESDKPPVFILGMPRTGSTLLERILSSHSRVTSQGETYALLSSVRQILGVTQADTLDFQRVLNDSLKMDFGSIGRRYLDYVEPRSLDCSYFIEKLPNNVFFAGLILKAIPGARIIYTDRNPMDACFSNFKQLFNPGFFPYSYDLIEAATHYQQVRDFALHWCERYPDRVTMFNYDELVTAPELNINKLLDFLGLEHEEACYSPEQNTAGLATASFAQARQPIYRSSSQKWKKFESQLAPLKNHLEASGLF
jgi:tetratricopeptide (TPR) repeat protein